MPTLHFSLDSSLGPAIRRIPSTGKELYLTFDDGPDPFGTPLVLDLLARHQAHATFFLIAEKAVALQPLVARIQMEGHAIGNHSLDHRFYHLWRGQVHLRTWLEQAEDQLRQCIGQATVGFRPPAGIRTPPLARALQTLRWTPILWSTRYYDALWKWTEARAQASLASVGHNNIVLLHDCQKESHRGTFLNTLDWFLGATRKQGYRCQRLTKGQIAGGPFTESR